MAPAGVRRIAAAALVGLLLGVLSAHLFSPALSSFCSPSSRPLPTSPPAPSRVVPCVAAAPLPTSPPPPPPPVYELFSGADVEGGDMGSLRSASQADLRAACDALPACRGFNSNGWLKSASWPRAGSDADLYLKRPPAPPQAAAVPAHAPLPPNAAAGGQRALLPPSPSPPSPSAALPLPLLRAAATATNSVPGVSAALLAEAEEMRRGLRVYIYSGITAGAGLRAPADYKYGAEGAFLARLTASSFVTTDAETATWFLLPTRCTAYRYAAGSREAGQALAETTTAAVLTEVVQRWPYWNRTRGADHFYVCAHDMGASVTGAAGAGRTGSALLELQKNAVALVNTADYADAWYVPHKDVALPPNVGDGCPTCIQGGHKLRANSNTPALSAEEAEDEDSHKLRANSNTPALSAEEAEDQDSQKLRANSNTPALSAEEAEEEENQSRPLLAFFAGNMGRGRVRPTVLQQWAGNADFVLHDGYLAPDAYVRGLQTAAFCLFLRGNRAWSPRLMDAVWAGCVPVIISDYYDLPLQGLVDWRRMSVIIAEADIARLHAILQRRRADLPRLRAELRRAAYHLTWHQPPLPLDAFESVLLQLWRRRHVSRYTVQGQ